MAIVMGLCSLGLMYKSMELPIGWIPEEGPGGGAFPFWLSAGCSFAACGSSSAGLDAPAHHPNPTNPTWTDRSLGLFAVTAGSLVVMVGLIHFIGVYGAVPLFLLFYMRFMGRHSWLLSGSLAVVPRS